jgi:polyisoprenoid-binding protein YceI
MLGSAAAVLVVAVFAVWWFLLRSDAPEAVSLEGAVASVTSSSTTTTEPPSDPVTSAPTTTIAETTTTTTVPAGSSIEGTWALVSDGTSFAGYRVEEELGTIGLTTAVGRSTEVEGSLTIDGDRVTDVQILVDMTALRSDDSRRDGAIRNQALETDAFPEASFSLTEPIDLPDGAAGGAAFAVDATGELLLHGVTRTVTIPLEAQLVEDNVVVVGSLPILFADYDIDPPRAAIVLSVDDNGIMEFQLVFGR